MVLQEFFLHDVEKLLAKMSYFFLWHDKYKKSFFNEILNIGKVYLPLVVKRPQNLSYKNFSVENTG